MLRSTPMRLAKRLAGAFLALLAWAVVAPGSSFAGCVHDRPMVSHFEGLISAGAMERPVDEAPLIVKKTPAGRMPTCSGPMCSRGPAAPSPAPWAAAPVNDSWALAIERVATVAPSAEPLPPEATPVLPLSQGPSVFHPPRIASI